MTIEEFIKNIENKVYIINAISRSIFEKSIPSFGYMYTDVSTSTPSSSPFGKTIGYCDYSKERYEEIKDTEIPVVMWSDSKDSIVLDVGGSLGNIINKWCDDNNYEKTKVNTYVRVHGDIEVIKNKIRGDNLGCVTEKYVEESVFKLQDALVDKSGDAIKLLKNILMSSHSLQILSVLTTQIRKLANGCVILSTGKGVKEINEMLGKDEKDKQGSVIATKCIRICKELHYERILCLLGWLGWVDREIKIRYADPENSLITGLSNYLFSNETFNAL